MRKTQLCSTSDIADNQCKGFSPEGGPQQTLFVVHRDNQYYAYHNHCPHTGVTLNWQDDQFLDITGHFIQCSVHGALFRISDGHCLRGPCLHRTLTPATIEVVGEEIFLLD